MLMTSSQAHAWTVVAALTSLAASLFTSAHAAALPADPADARAVTPPLNYQSPFSQVRRLSEAPLGAWPQKRQATEPMQVMHGHHHGHGRAAATSAQGAASDPHAGHSSK